jgi:hypothetical protein
VNTICVRQQLEGVDSLSGIYVLTLKLKMWFAVKIYVHSWIFKLRKMSAPSWFHLKLVLVSLTVLSFCHVQLTLPAPPSHLLASL